MTGSQGEFYISRYDNYGNAENPQTAPSQGTDPQEGKTSNLPQEYTSNTGQRNFSDNEWAQIYIPRDGWLTPIMMDVPDPDDTIVLKTSPSDSPGLDLKAQPLSQYIDIIVSESVIEWQTDMLLTGHGWTFIFQPDYPELELPMGTPMAQAASGYRIVSVYGSLESAAYTTDYTQDSPDCSNCAGHYERYGAIRWV